MPVFESETITHSFQPSMTPEKDTYSRLSYCCNRYLNSCAWITFTPQCVLSVKAVNCQQDDSVDNYNLYEVNPLTVCCFKSVPYIRAKSGQWKKNCYRNIQLPGGFASFPGAREVSSISGRLPDDPGGITCMQSVHVYCIEITKNWAGNRNNKSPFR